MKIQHKRRAPRYRTLNDDHTISPLFGDWDRTISFSDIRKWMYCPAMYLMWKEGDPIYRVELSGEIGELVHEETAKPVAERLQDTKAIAERLQSIPKEDRAQAAIVAKELIARAARFSDDESAEAAVTQHEHLMVLYNKYTNTYWYAKPDKMDILTDEHGTYLNVVDQKSGSYRSKLDKSGAFFFGYVAKMTEHFGFRGTVRTVVRYLKDFRGHMLETPDDKATWIGRNLSPQQNDMLFGIQETVDRIDGNWRTGKFSFNQGKQCNRCQFRHSCAANKDLFAEQQREEAERLAEQEAICLPVMNIAQHIYDPRGDSSSCDGPEFASTALPAVLKELVAIQPSMDLRAHAGA